MNIEESKDFLVSTASLKEVRTFSRDVFDKLNLNKDLKDELVLAIAEAAQNIVKHAYKGVEDTKDHMQIKISMKDNQLEIGFYDKGKPVVSENIQHRKLDDIKPGAEVGFHTTQAIPPDDNFIDRVVSVINDPNVYSSANHCFIYCLRS